MKWKCYDHDNGVQGHAENQPCFRCSDSDTVSVGGACVENNGKNSGNSPMLQHVSPSPLLLRRCLTFSSAELRKRRRVEIEQKREKDLKIVLSITTLTFFLLHLPRSDIIDIIGDVATNDSMTQGCDRPV